MKTTALYVLAICALIASTTDANTCDSQVESCTTYKQPIKKQSFWNRLWKKWEIGMSKGSKSMKDLRYGTQKKN